MWHHIFPGSNFCVSFAFFHDPSEGSMKAVNNFEQEHDVLVMYKRQKCEDVVI